MILQKPDNLQFGRRQGIESGEYQTTIGDFLNIIGNMLRTIPINHPFIRLPMGSQ